MFERQIARVRGLLTRRRAESELNEELRFHLEMETRANLERGLSPRDARRVALRDLGGIDQTREGVRDQRATWIDALQRDLAHGWRALVRRPALSASLVITLALGQAVSGSLFAILDGLVFKPLPFRDPTTLFVAGPRSRFRPDRASTVRPDEVEAFARHPLVKGAFGMCLRVGFFESQYAATEGLRDSGVTGGFFDVLGVMPIVGRPLGPGDAVRSEPRPVVIGHALWRTRFAAEASALGRPVVLGNRHVVIVGIMPPAFDFPGGANVWLADVPPASAMSYLTAVVRVSPGDERHLTLSTAREACLVEPLRKYLDPGGTGSVVALFLVTAITVVMAWVHLGGLQMAQALDRAREMATRLALGARLSQIARQWFAETLMLCGAAFVGAAVALPALLALFVRLLPAEMSLGQPIAVDGRTLAYLGALTVFGSTALVLGPIAVIRQARLGDILHGGLPAFGSANVARARWVLLAGQVGLLTAVLYVAALAVLSLDRLNRTDVGFDATNLLEVDLPRAPSAGAARSVLSQVRQRVTGLPFVIDAAEGDLPLLAGRMPVFISAMPPGTINELETRNGAEWWVSPGYFRTLRARLIAGSDAEIHTRPDAVLVSEAAAKEMGLAPPVLGRRVYVNAISSTIVGVVADVLSDGPERPPTPYVYVPVSYELAAAIGSALVVRTSRPAAEVAPAIVQAVRDVTGEKGPVKVTLASDLVARATAGPRSRSVLLTVLALASLALGMVGIFSATNEAVGRRLRDIAVRMVLGADPGRVVRHTVGRTLVVVGVGLVSGLAVGVAAGQWASNLFTTLPAIRITATCGVVVVLLGGAAIAAFGPAYQAGRTDPLVVLRHE